MPLRQRMLHDTDMLKESLQQFKSDCSLKQGARHLKGPQGSLGNLRKTYILTYFREFLRYFLDFWSNIKAFGQNNVIFELLQQKPCRISYKFHQKPSFGPIWHVSGPEWYFDEMT